MACPQFDYRFSPPHLTDAQIAAANREYAEYLVAQQKWAAQQSSSYSYPGDAFNSPYSNRGVSPAKALPLDHWSIVLGVSPSATVAEIKKAYRDLARTAHADSGGSDEMMVRLNIAKDAALQERGTI